MAANQDTRIATDSPSKHFTTNGTYPHDLSCASYPTMYDGPNESKVQKEKPGSSQQQGGLIDNLLGSSKDAITKVEDALGNSQQNCQSGDVLNKISETVQADINKVASAVQDSIVGASKTAEATTKDPQADGSVDNHNS